MPSGVVRTMRFAGEVGKSFIDGRPALMRYYSEFLSHNKDNGMTNEVRKLKDGLFVGIISTAATMPTGDLLIPPPAVANRMRELPAARLGRGRESMT